MEFQGPHDLHFLKDAYIYTQKFFAQQDEKRLTSFCIHASFAFTPIMDFRQSMPNDCCRLHNPRVVNFDRISTPHMAKNVPLKFHLNALLFRRQHVPNPNLMSFANRLDLVPIYRMPFALGTLHSPFQPCCALEAPSSPNRMHAPSCTTSS